MAQSFLTTRSKVLIVIIGVLTSIIVFYSALYTCQCECYPDEPAEEFFEEDLLEPIETLQEA